MLRLVVFLTLNILIASVTASSGFLDLNKKKLDLYNITYDFKNITVFSPIMEVWGKNVTFKRIKDKPAALISNQTDWAKIEANEIVYDADKKILVLTGDVSIISQGAKLTSGKVVYDIDKDKFNASSKNEQVELTFDLPE